MIKKKKDKRTNNDLQNTTHKTKDRATRTPLKTGRGEGGVWKCCGRKIFTKETRFREYPSIECYCKLNEHVCFFQFHLI
jgi:hypothetical protein